MSSDLNKRRRQVAWFCFKPLLSEKQLIQAIKILEQDYQRDGVSNLVAYITKVCNEFHIETAKSILLYGQFREHMQQAHDTLPDPLTLVFEQNSASTTTQSLSLKATLPASIQDPNTKPPYCIVFTYFMQQIIAGIAEKSALFATLKELTTSPKRRPTPLTALINRWLINPDDYAWVTPLDEKTLASIVHLVYMALCELLGPIDADEVFHKAITNTEQQPEAKQFSPTRFL